MALDVPQPRRRGASPRRAPARPGRGAWPLPTRPLRCLACLACLAAAVACGPDPTVDAGAPAPLDAGSDAPLDAGPPDELVLPEGWTCGERFYGEGWCDCGCGARDVDCPDDDLHSCHYSGCRGEDERPDPRNPVACQPMFETCNPEYVWASQLPRRYPWAPPEPQKPR